MKINKLMKYLQIIFVALYLSMSFSNPVQATPIIIATSDETQTSPLLEFLKEILDDDPSPFTNALVSKALEDILKQFDFLSEFVDKEAADAEKRLKEQVEADMKEIEKELDEAIEKMIDDAIKEALKDDPEIVDDLEVEVDIDFSILDPLDLLNQISIGSFPQKLSFTTPIELMNNTDVNVEFLLADTITFVDSRGVDILRLDNSTVRVSQVPAPPVILLLFIGFLAHLVMRIKQ